MLRPYVFVFLAAFLTAGFLKMGKRKTLGFMCITWTVAFICEFSSTRNGSPFRLYHYIGDTKDQELFLSNIPFYDSLSFSFLLFASYSMALFMLSPLKISKKTSKYSIISSFVRASPFFCS
ncbi:MAG: carotenoid biosynthesis protein [Bdellovibrionota bacterium]